MRAERLHARRAMVRTQMLRMPYAREAKLNTNG